jgi:hypothetical protein
MLIVHSQTVTLTVYPETSSLTVTPNNIINHHTSRLAVFSSQPIFCTVCLPSDHCLLSVRFTNHELYSVLRVRKHYGGQSESPLILLLSKRLSPNPRGLYKFRRGHQSLRGNVVHVALLWKRYKKFLTFDYCTLYLLFKII